jgi:hypothetical protein
MSRIYMADHERKGSGKTAECLTGGKQTDLVT